MSTILKTLMVGTMFGIFVSSGVMAQGTGRGLVGTYCKAEIAKYCANVPHTAGAVPACLYQNKAKLSLPCLKALSNQGPGRGMGPGRGGRWR